jgi:translation initiation factor IF-2
VAAEAAWDGARGYRIELMKMAKVRINDLAKELEVKSRQVLDCLPLLGISDIKTHSSSLEYWEVAKVKEYFPNSRSVYHR